jgi:hypothetical protein
MSKMRFPLGGLLSAVLVCIFLSAESFGQSNGDVVVTVSDEIGSSLTGATFIFRTTGMAATQTVTDGDVGDSDGAANGVIWITAASMTVFGANNNDNWINNSVSRSGYLTETNMNWSGGGGPGPANQYRTNRINSSTVSLSFTVRVDEVRDQFDNQRTLTAANTAFSGLLLNGSVQYSGGDAYLPAVPGTNAALAITHTGFITTQTTATVTPSAAAQVRVQYGTGGGQEEGPALPYNTIVMAYDEFENVLTLAQGTTGFSGLTLNGSARYSGGSAFLPAGPAAPGRLTLSLQGYDNVTTTAVVAPSAITVDTILFRPVAGDGPGLPYTVLVRAWDELGVKRLNLTGANTLISGVSLNGSVRYSDGTAYLPMDAQGTITITHTGYVTATSVIVTPRTTVRDTVDFKPAGGSGSGLSFTLRVRVLDAANKLLNTARVELLDGSYARQHDIYGDSVWVSPTPASASTGSIYIAVNPAADDNQTLVVRVQHNSYLPNHTLHLMNQLDSDYQVQLTAGMVDFLVQPTLKYPFDNAVVGTLTPILAWNTVVGADSFQIQVDSVASFTSRVLDTIISVDSLIPASAFNDRQRYLWHIRAKGVEGAIGAYSDAWSFTVNLDTLPPSVEILYPLADSTYSGVITVRFRATDNDSVNITEISVDGKDFIPTTTDSTYMWTTTGLIDGTHFLQIRATDASGNTGFSRIVAVQIRNAPAVTITSPRADAVVTGTFTVLFTATPVSPATIVRREIWVDGGFVDTSTTDSTFDWNTLLRNDGQHTLQVRIKDSNGKTGRSELVSLTTFNTPIVSIVTPSDIGVVSGIDTIRFTVTYAPGSYRDTTEIAFNGSIWRPTTDSQSYVWVTTGFLDGNHNMQVRATASNGKAGFSQIAAYKISNVPQVAILAPLGGEALNSVYTVRFATTPVSPATIARRMVSIDGNPWSDSLVDSTSFLMSTIGWEEGTHSIQVRAIDDKGRNGYSSQRSFVVDNAPPIAADPKAEYPNNAVSAARNASILITVLAKDVLTGLAADSGVVLRSDNIDTAASLALVMRDDGQGGDKVADDNIYSVTVSVTSNATGSIGYSITAQDRLNNAITMTSAIRLDNTPPEISFFSLTPEPEVIAAPHDKRSYFDKLLMRGAYSDEGGSGLSRVMVSIKNDSAVNVNNSPIDLSPKDSLFSRIIHLVPGKNYLAFEAVDNAGNATIRRDTVTYIEPKATKTISREGGAIACPNGVSVTIPKDALLRATEITITRVLPIDEPKPLSVAIKLLQVPHDFGPDGTAFRKSVTVTLSYSEADLDPDQNGVNEFDPAKFTIVFWDGSTWLPAGNVFVDSVNRHVSVEVNHFTTFDIAQKETPAIENLVTYWTRNPATSSSGSYFNYELPGQGTVSLAIMDMAGDLVYQLIPKNTSRNQGSYSVGWRGQNVAERFAGAGLYVYLFTYKENITGQTKIIRKPIGLLK